MACLPVSGKWKKANKPVRYPQGQTRQQWPYPSQRGPSAHGLRSERRLCVTIAKTDQRETTGNPATQHPTTLRQLSTPTTPPPPPMGSGRPVTSREDAKSRAGNPESKLFQGERLNRNKPTQQQGPAPHCNNYFKMPVAWQFTPDTNVTLFSLSSESCNFK